MKSGLEGRNNLLKRLARFVAGSSLNEVRPRRPEQSVLFAINGTVPVIVSMKSGLEGRNNRMTFIPSGSS